MWCIQATQAWRCRDGYVLHNNLLLLVFLCLWCRLASGHDGGLQQCLLPFRPLPHFVGRVCCLGRPPHSEERSQKERKSHADWKSSGDQAGGLALNFRTASWWDQPEKFKVNETVAVWGGSTAPWDYNRTCSPKPHFLRCSPCFGPGEHRFCCIAYVAALIGET